MSADTEITTTLKGIPSIVDTSELIESTRKAIECDLQLTNSGNKLTRDKVFLDQQQVQVTQEDNEDEDSKSEEHDDKSLAGGSSSSNSKSLKNFVPPVNWANAPEFVPRSFVPVSDASSPSESNNRSYAQVVGAGGGSILQNDMSLTGGSPTSNELCPYAMVGECRFGVKCAYLHGLKCEFCGMACLHPYCPEQREKHSRECVDQHEKDMELSFAVAQSTEKTCGICMEVVMEKSPPGEQRFGILPSCVHCFCLSCIRKWRQARQFENKIIRACPECRVTSDYICPSRYWVEKKEEKDKLIQSYLESLSKKPCRYYRSGVGDCPFGNKCFYLHAGPDGRSVDVGPPRRRIRRQNANGVASDAQAVSIWEFLEQWELQWFEIEDLMDMMDSDDTSLWSGEEDDDFEHEGYFEAFESALSTPGSDLSRFNL